ncbi:MAG TPA: hypothetical protein VHB99_02170 [Pirellulales bacterium]|nr:hypothetical protein [Pirellulales bacterium]
MSSGAWLNPGAAKGRRRWRRWLAIAFALTLAIVALGPYLLSWEPVRRLVLAVVPSRVHGTISTGSASLGWFMPPQVADLEIDSRSGESLLSVGRIELERPLWRLAWAPSDWGEVRVEQARLRLVLTADGKSNVEEVLGIPIKIKRTSGGGGGDAARANSAPAPPRPAPNIRRKLDLHLSDAEVVWRTPEATRDWSVAGINLAVGLRPAWSTASGLPEILIQRGKVLDHCQLSPGLCNDALKYVAPILSKVTRAEGEISIDLDDWRLPLGHPEQGELGGRLSLHNVDVGPGPFVRKLAEALHVPPDVAMARESIVRFELVNGRIEHHDLEFDLPGVHVRTSGSVGFDRSLDLLAEVELRLPEKLLSESQLARALSEKTLKSPIVGSLTEPRLDAGFVRELGLAKLFDKLESLGAKLPGEKAADGKATDGGSSADAGDGQLLSTETVELLEDMLAKWSERRRSKRQESLENRAEAGADQPEVEEAKPKTAKRPLERLRDRLRRPPRDDAP